MKRPAAFTRNGNGMALLTGGCRMGFRTCRKPPSQRTLRRGQEKKADKVTKVSSGMGRDIGTIAATRDVMRQALAGGAALGQAIREDTGEGGECTPISPLAGEMSPEATEGGDGLAGFQAFEAEPGGLPPSALPGISPARGEIDSQRVPLSIVDVGDDRGGGDPFDGFHPGFGRDWDFAGRNEQKPPAGDW